MSNDDFIAGLKEHEKIMYEESKWAEGTGNTASQKNCPVSLLNDRIDFNPFQYEPYYKLTQQTGYPKAIYIADEVGSGKTIETGIILTELIFQKEYNIRTDVCLIICPNLLCRKWRDTLKGLFGLDASIVYSAKEVHIGINIISYDTVSRKEGEIDINLKPTVFIMDEAHNASGDRFEKISKLRNAVDDKKGYVLLLSATPLSGQEEDAGKQLQLLRPDLTCEGDFFNTESKYLCKNKKAVMRYAVDPQNYMVDVKILNHYVKNDVLSSFCDTCQELFAGRNTLLQFQGINSLMSSPAAGKKFLDNLLKKSDEEMLNYLISSHETPEDDEDDESEDDDAEISELPEYTIDDVQRIKSDLEKIRTKLEGTGDKKLEELKSLIKNNSVKSHSDDIPKERPFYKHIIVFTDKLSTAKYLENQLSELKCIKVFRVTGELFESEKRTRLQQYENENDKISVLIITNVACEGQDMDFGNTIVNYDLDYNPVRLEQRRGRIDRFEVKKNKIFIHNFMVDDVDFDPVDQEKQYHQYSKVKKIWDKIQSIHQSTGSFYEILYKPNNQQQIDENLEERKKAVFDHIFKLLGQIPDGEIKDSTDLYNKVMPMTLSYFGEYSSVYDMISERMRDLGDLKIERTTDNKLTITTSISNQDFLRYIYHGGTLISHLVLGEK